MDLLNIAGHVAGIAAGLYAGYVYKGWADPAAMQARLLKAATEAIKRIETIKPDSVQSAKDTAGLVQQVADLKAVVGKL
jgi:hypothetical protein